MAPPVKRTTSPHPRTTVTTAKISTPKNPAARIEKGIESSPAPTTCIPSPEVHSAVPRYSVGQVKRSGHSPRELGLVEVVRRDIAIPRDHRIGHLGLHSVVSLPRTLR
eukprot:TRINITY_DN62522_c0_g1_i1.p1 TRINITY_DN62522_c0_g1~~TRINITY_DN62522_c0_g1_i1.p1  ORF type:complete len:108 (+),score=4.18 TRINITY_DN62522_c0_g1_i1:111-434(+)